MNYFCKKMLYANFDYMYEHALPKMSNELRM
jgi:hypothetical protein